MVTLWDFSKAFDIATEKEKEVGGNTKEELRLIYMAIVYIYNIEEQPAFDMLAEFVYRDAKEFEWNSKSGNCHLVKDEEGNITEYDNT